MIKEIFFNGFTASPDDLACHDGDLAVATNLVPSTDGLHPLPQPSVAAEGLGNQLLVLIHTTSDDKRFILKDNNAFFWRTALDAPSQPFTLADFNPDNTNDITAIGNTLVFATTIGLRFVLWKDNSYVILGEQPPEINLQFSLHIEQAVHPGLKPGSSGSSTNPDYFLDPLVLHGNVDLDRVPLPDYDNSEATAWVPPAWMVPLSKNFNAFSFSLENAVNADGNQGHIDAFVNRMTNWAIGGVNAFVNQLGTSQNKFVFPFFVRYAYELYDGTTIMHSYPVLMMPSNRPPLFALNSIANKDHGGLKLDWDEGDSVAYMFRGRIYGHVATLQYRYDDNSLNLWSDIVRSVNVYVSPQTFLYDPDGKVYGWKSIGLTAAQAAASLNGTIGYATAGLTRLSGISTYNAAEMSGYTHGQQNPSSFCLGYAMDIPAKTEDDVKKQLADESRFFLAARLNVNDIGQTRTSFAALPMAENTLGSLAARQQLADDYHSRDSIIADKAYVYNGRLNLSGISRLLHNPLSPDVQFASVAPNNNVTRQTAVLIRQSGNTLSLVSPNGAASGILPLFVFYPDDKASAVFLSNNPNDDNVYRVSLSEHALLNGSCWLGNIFTDDPTPANIGWKIAGVFPQESATPVNELAKIYTSEVNNPFRFPLTGINTVGTGRIIDICAAAQAMSQGQFGQFPLYAFTDEGVWALELNTNGTWSRVHPITRDVVLGNGRSITQLDNSVLFATARGIMQLSGSTATCISDAIDDHAGNFKAFLDNCAMLYDYPNQRVFVFNNVFNNASDAPAFVLDLQSARWSRADLRIFSAVNAYPDALANAFFEPGNNAVLDFSQPDYDNLPHPCLLTRPLKLDLPGALKTVRRVIIRGHARLGAVNTTLEASRDLFKWYRVASSTDNVLQGFSGTPYKYFRLRLNCNLRRDESLYGATVEFVKKYTNRIR